MGPKVKVLIDLCISLAQFSFTVSHISFVVQSLQTTVNVQSGYATPAWPYCVMICIILTLIAWIEDIKKFSMTFLIGNLLIFTTVLVVSGYCVYELT